MRAQFDHTEDVAEHIKTFWFKPERTIHHIAGQFIELRIPHENKDKRGDKRWFTLSSAPSDGLVSITTKLAGESGSSFKKALLELTGDSEVTITDPMGDFVLPKDESVEIVFVAGGIGVTPMHSMIKFLHDTGSTRPITLIYAANDEKQLAFTDLFDNSDVDFVPVIANPSASWKGETGQIDAERIISLAGGHDGKYIYISGPEPMIEALYKGLKKAGVNKRYIVTDYFPGYEGV